ncbi:MAG: hypothetical protein JNK79_12345 [Chitinophagaceae bacterium]|nr:hypothetical protein [Chitinophagaceae bacterium]
MKYSLILLAATLLFVSCQKDLSLENAQPVTPEPPVVPPPPPPPPVEVSRKYQLTAFYSDIPIDFVESDDVVKSETDLWSYVNEYLKDDIDEFSNDTNELLVHQGDIKIPGNDSAVLHKTYFLGTDEHGPYLRFLGPEYEVLRYRLLEMTDDHIIIYLPWKHNSTVYSRFDRVK